MKLLWFSFLLVLIPAINASVVEESLSEDDEMSVPVDDGLHLTDDECECNSISAASLGVESGVITEEQITVSSTYETVYTEKTTRSTFKSGWKPRSNDANPWIKINLGKVMELHGLGTKGHATEPLWVTRYTVELSTDDVTYTPLLDRLTGKPRVFTGNTNQDEWKNQCLRGYYGDAPEAQYVRFTLLEHNGNGYGIRIELYGFRDAEDEALLRALEKDVWTTSTTGCQCYFDPTRFDCACCEYGAEQCNFVNRHQCVKSDSPSSNCGIPELSEDIQDPWTESFTGCTCSWDTSRTDCACCKNGGGQCGPTNKNQCVQYGLPDACGKKESVFGVNEYCEEVPAHCRA